MFKIENSSQKFGSKRKNVNCLNVFYYLQKLLLCNHSKRKSRVKKYVPKDIGF